MHSFIQQASTLYLLVSNKGVAMRDLALALRRATSGWETDRLPDNPSAEGTWLRCGRHSLGIDGALDLLDWKVSSRGGTGQADMAGTLGQPQGM